MKIYKIIAKYHSDVELMVTVPDDKDPMDPGNWDEIEDEYQVDFYLWNVEDAIECNEQGFEK